MRKGILRWLTYSNVMSTIAVFGVLAGGGAYAASKIKLKKNSVTSAKIKDGTVSSADIANGAIVSADVATNGLTGASVKESTLGPVPKAQDADTLGGVPRDGFYEAGNAVSISYKGCGTENFPGGPTDCVQPGTLVDLDGAQISATCLKDQVYGSLLSVSTTAPDDTIVTADVQQQDGSGDDHNVYSDESGNTIAAISLVPPGTGDGRNQGVATITFDDPGEPGVVTVTLTAVLTYYHQGVSGYLADCSIAGNAIRTG